MKKTFKGKALTRSNVTWIVLMTSAFAAIVTWSADTYSSVLCTAVVSVFIILLVGNWYSNRVIITEHNIILINELGVRTRLNLADVKRISVRTKEYWGTLLVVADDSKEYTCPINDWGDSVFADFISSIASAAPEITIETTPEETRDQPPKNRDVARPTSKTYRVAAVDEKRRTD